MKINNKNMKYLFLYKSIFFRFCKFETDSKDPQDIIIVNALNIKNRKKRITYIYDATCDYIDNFYGRENICGFKNCQCYMQQKKMKDTIDGCCRKCVYVTDKGCPSRNLSCKLFNCSEVYSRRKVITYKDLKVLKLFSLRQRIIIKSDYFTLREDALKDLYSYSLTYTTIRVIIRLINNFIIKKYKKEQEKKK